MTNIEEKSKKTFTFLAFSISFLFTRYTAHYITRSLKFRQYYYLSKYVIALFLKTWADYIYVINATKLKDSSMYFPNLFIYIIVVNRFLFETFCFSTLLWFISFLYLSILCFIPNLHPYYALLVPYSYPVWTLLKISSKFLLKKHVKSLNKKKQKSDIFEAYRPKWLAK